MPHLSLIHIYEHLPKEKQRLQGARCMECGVPFCQSGMMICGMASGCPPVSYTHLDVYKRQVLGPTGKNFAAGMSGGIAYVLDEGNDLYKRLNKEMVSSSEITSKYDVLELKFMIQEHVALTNSAKGKEVLDNFGEYLPKFKKIIPHDYERVLKTIVQMEEKGLSAEQAQIEAFYANTRKYEASVKSNLDRLLFTRLICAAGATN